MSRFSPVVIEAMLHAYYSAEPHPRQDAPAFQTAFRFLYDAGLIIRNDNADAPTRYMASDKGRARVDMILRTPMPELRRAWADPRTNEIIQV